MRPATLETAERSLVWSLSIITKKISCQTDMGPPISLRLSFRKIVATWMKLFWRLYFRNEVSEAS